MPALESTDPCNFIENMVLTYITRQHLGGEIASLRARPLNSIQAISSAISEKTNKQF